MAPAMTDVLRRSMAGGERDHIVVVPKQLTLQTERALLAALDLKGSFRLQVLSPERLCGRIFEAAGQPGGARVDERGRVMLVRAAVHSVDDRLRLYHGAAERRGFAERCARQLELIRQAGLTPERLFACAEQTEGLLRMKLDDLGVILEAYEDLLEGRFQDGESEFAEAVSRAPEAMFLRDACVFFYGFDLTPPMLHRLIGAVGAVCADTHVFLPLANDENARDFDAFLPLKGCLERMIVAARRSGVWPERIMVEAEGVPDERRLVVAAPAQAAELAHLSGELFAYPVSPWPGQRPPLHVQAVTLRDPMEECRFAAALCRRLAMKNGWRWNDMLILCRDIDGYRQPLKEAFRACGVPLFLSASRPASRHPLAESLIDALRLTEAAPRSEDALALLRAGYMPLEADEACRLCNYIEKYALKPRALSRPLRRGSEAEREALEPLRARFAAPVGALKRRLKRSRTLKDQLAAVYGFMADIGAADRLRERLNTLAEAALREQAGEEGQVWNRIVGALDQMAGLMGDDPLPVSELRQTLTESLDAAIIKPLPQSGDAVYAQTTDRITAQRAKALLILGETDRVSADADGLLNAAQTQAFSRLARAWLGSDGMELSRMRRFYLKASVEMTGEYLCVSAPLSGLDGGAQRPGALHALLKGVFPALPVRGGISEDENVQWMLRNAPAAASAWAARSLSELGEGEAARPWDIAALAGLRQIARGPDATGIRRSLEQIGTALRRSESADALNPETAAALYGALRRQSISRLEQYAKCPFAYFTGYGLRPERIEPYQLNPRDEGTFFHNAVHEFLLASMDDLSTLDEDAAGQRMDAIADRLLDALADQGPLGDSAVALAERRRLKATARTCAGVLARHMRDSRFSTAALETDFGPEDGPARLAVRVDGGECALEGRIDRIDEWAEGGSLRVIDYKRGGRELALDAVYHGLSLQLPVYLAAAMRRRNARSAGVYYFPLDEGILTLQSTDPGEIERKRLNDFRLRGLAPADPELLKAQSPRFDEVLNLRTTATGELYKDAPATDDSGFRAMMRRALEKAGEHLNAIRGGVAEVAPVRFRRENPCNYCDWRGVCLYDERLDARRARRFEKMKPDEALLSMKRAADGQKEGINPPDEA